MTSNFFLSFFNVRSARNRSDVSNRNGLRRANLNALKPRRLSTETLEERRLLAASTELADMVAALNDYVGFGGTFDEGNLETTQITSEELSVATLKAAIEKAATTPGDDAIFIVGGGTITFGATDEAFVVDLDDATQGSLTIIGYDGEFTIDAAGVDRAFVVKNGTFNLGSATLKNGFAAYGGAIANAGTTTIDTVSVSLSEATLGGGAVANKGVFCVQNSSITDCVSRGNGAAFFEGDFSFDVVPTPDAVPEIAANFADVSAANGATIVLNLADYFSAGDWNYSFDCSDVAADLFAAEPTLENGKLTLEFIGNADYSEALDLSSVSFTVSATSKTDASAVATSNRFNVSLANQKTATIQAVFSTLTTKQAAEQYAVYAESDVDEENPLGYGATTIPTSEAIDSDSFYLQLWAQDSASLWNVDSLGLQSFTVVARVYNAALTVSTQNLFGQMAVIASETAGDGFVDYKISVLYGVKSSFGVDSGKILASAKVERINSDAPVFVELLSSPDARDPVASRLVAGTAEAVTVNLSQFKLTGCANVVAEMAPEYSFAAIVAGDDVDFEDELDVVAPSTETETSTTISNSIIARNAAVGNGVFYVDANGFLDVYNATIVDNSAQTSVFCAEESDGDIYVANSIFYQNVESSSEEIAETAATLDPTNAGEGLFNLSDFGSWENNFEIDATASLFVDFSNGNYALAENSQAINRGSAELAVDVFYSPLTTDVAGGTRYAVPDVGAFEYQGTAPAAPTNAYLSNYSADDKKLKISWTDVATNESNYCVAVRYESSENWNEITIAANSKGGWFNIAIDSERTYIFRVWAKNDFGKSDAVEIVFNASTDVLTTASLSTNAPKVGESISVAVEGTPDSSAYRWYRVDSDGVETKIDGAESVSYTPVASDVGFYLKAVVAARVGDYIGSFSATTTATVVSVEVDPNVPDAPIAPSALTLSAYDSENARLTLSWTDNSNNETSFLVETRTNGGAWTTATTTSSNATSATLSSISATEKVEIRVSAINDGGTTASGTIAFNASTDVLTTLSISTNEPKVGVMSLVELAPLTATATYRWFRVDATGAETEISGATSSSYTPVAADAGFYLKAVATGANAAYVSTVSATTTKTIAAADVPTAPLAPNELRLSDFNAETGSVVVRWTDNSNNETSFLVETRTNGGAWTTATTTSSNATSATLSSISATEKVEIRVSAINDGGTTASETAAFNASTDVLTTLNISTNEPKVGVMLTISGIPTDAISSFEWSRIDATTGSATPILGATNASFVPSDSDVDSYLKVSATVQIGVYVSNLSATTTEPVARTSTASEIPAAPSELTLSGYNASNASLTLSWTDNSSNETGFLIEYRLEEGEWSSLTATAAGVTSAIVSSLPTSGSLAFRVCAFNSTGTSDSATANFNASTDVLTAINFLTNAPVVGETTTVSVAPFGAPATYRWFRVDANGAETEITGATSASYSPNASDVGFYLKVVATGENSAYVSAISATSAAPVVVSGVPAAPSALYLSDFDATTGSLAVHWQDNSFDETGFRVEVRTNGGNWTTLTTTEPEATSATVSSISSTQTVEFRVTAFNDGGASASGTASFNASTDVLTALNLSTNAPKVGDLLTISGIPTSAAATFVWRRVDGAGVATAIPNAASSTYKASVSDLGFYLRGSAEIQVGVYKSSLSATTTETVVNRTTEEPEEHWLPAEPSDFVFGKYDAAAQTLSATWTDNSNNETSFEIRRAENGGAWSVVALVDADETAAVLGATTADGQYEFRIRAVRSYLDENNKKVDVYSDWVSASFSAARDVVDSVSLSSQTPVVGEELVASVADGKNVVYQWFRVANGVWETVDGATASKYAPTDSDVGYSIGVLASSANEAFLSSAKTATANFVYETETSRPDAPTDLTFTNFDSAKKTITLSWTNASKTATQIVVEYRVGDGSWGTAATLSVDAIENVALKVAADAEYSYRLTAVNSVGESLGALATFEADRDVLTSISVDSAPVVGDEVRAVLGNAENKATFQWFRVDERGVETTIQDATTAQYVPTSADLGFRLKVVATGANAAYFAQVSTVLEPVAEPATPVAPTDAAFGQYDAATGKVQLSWNDNSTNETGFLVERSTDGGATWRELASIEYDSTTLTCWGLIKGTSYSFRVAAFNGNGVSDWTIAEITIPTGDASAAVFEELTTLEILEDDATADLLAENIVQNGTNSNDERKDDKIEFSFEAFSAGR